VSAPFRRISAIAGTTFTEMARLRVFYVLAIFALVLIASSSFLARMSFEQELRVTRDIALGAVSFFLSLLAIVATAQLLPRDMEDRVIYSVLAKPVPRFEYMLGKFLGILALLILSLAAMSVLCLAVIYLRQQTAVREALTQFSQSTEEERQNALRMIYSAGVSRDLIAALLAMLAKAILLAAAALCISSFATSSIFTITAMAMIYFVGHLEPVAREYWLQQHTGGLIAKTFLGLVALVFPDLQAFNLSDQISVGSTIGNALLLRLFELAIFYTVTYLLLAIAIFYQREL
jgi:hypothetical protein